MLKFILKCTLLNCLTLLLNGQRKENESTRANTGFQEGELKSHEIFYPPPLKCIFRRGGEVGKNSSTQKIDWGGKIKILCFNKN
jgi:hypothetical protein